MKSLLPRLSVIALACCLGIQLANARVGDSRSTLERRLLTEGGAVKLLDDEVFEQHFKKSPFKDTLDPESDTYEMVLYYKTADGGKAYSSRVLDDRERPVANPDGWLIFVVYARGQSVFEAYKRSSGLTEAESNGLLLLNRGDGTWNRGTLPTDAYPSKDYKPLLKHNLFRSDNQLLAQQNGSYLVLFDVDFDAYLSRTKHEKEMEEAPNSLNGF
ncbi:MAG: hypothetical protein AAFX93_05185 [Verrucomicrobiota bacterium]